MPSYDLAILGGGIVGLATAYRFQQQFPGKSVVLLEKEAELAAHQTGHNSGVLHSGIYYQPGSLKASHCREGRRAMIDFCAREDIPHEICGKVIVAVDASELSTLDKIHQRAEANQVRTAILNRDQLLALEPQAAGIRALHVPDTGIVDYRLVYHRLAQRIEAQGGKIFLGGRVTSIQSGRHEVLLRTTLDRFTAAQVVNCTGLYSDRVVHLAGVQPLARIIPFRGEYYELIPAARHLVRNLIYPVPDPTFPFLGVHFTRMIDGNVECGPNAVLAWAREGYTKLTIHPKDLLETLTYSGFLRLAARHWRMGAGEMWRSISKQAFVRALQRLLPAIRADHLHSAPAGVRAQAVTPGGRMIDDFLLQETDRVVHVVNAPSPAATASLKIGATIVDQLADRFS